MPIACGAIVLACFVGGGVLHYSNQEESGSAFLTGFLFFIPLAVQACALVFLVRRVNWSYYFFNLTVTTICFGSCFYFWIRYLGNKQLDGATLQFTSHLTLFAILLLLVSVGIMTYSIMRPSSNHLGGEFCTKLNAGVREHPFWAIMFFFTLFLGVAYLFGFSLAFHDKYAKTRLDKSNRPALRMVNYKSIDDPQDEPSPTLTSAQGSHTTQTTTPGLEEEPTQAASRGGVEPAVNQFSFYFKSGEARLGKDRLAICTAGSPPRRQWNRDSSGPRQNEKFNHCSLEAVVAKINEATKDGKRIRVTLIGHGDNEQVSRNPILGAKPIPLHYLSNYELSEARVHNVKYEISKMFGDSERWHNIEWLSLPASNEDVEEIEGGLINQDLFQPKELDGKFTQDEIAKGIKPEHLVSKLGHDVITKLYSKLTPEKLAEEKRVVLVAIKSISDHVADLEMSLITQQKDPRTLGLMDYMYFSIYTITTTGYGDIVPTTAYGKFVTSLANFCEVLFLVVFFNALISIKANPQDPKTTQVKSPLPLIPSNDKEKPPEEEKAQINLLRLPSKKGKRY